MTGLQGIAELGRVVFVYCAIGVSAGIGSSAGAIVNSNFQSDMRKKIIVKNLLCALVSIVIFGTASVILSRVHMDGQFLLAFFIFSLLAISCTQLAVYGSFWLSKNHILHKYSHFVVGPWGVLVLLCTILSLITESLFSGLIAGVLGAALVRRLFQRLSAPEINKGSTNILVYLLSGLLGTGMYYSFGFVIFMVAVRISEM
jgi:hypothetical protein